MDPTAKRFGSVLWLVASMALVGGRAVAGESVTRLASRWDIKEMTRDFPQAVDTFRQADASAAKGDAAQALVLFSRAASLAPRSPAPPRRICEILTDLGRRSEALDACRRALRFGDAPEDYRAMVGALMAGRDAPSTEDFVQALLIGSGLETRSPDDPMSHAAMFDIARRLGERRLMRTQLDALLRLAPQHYETGRAHRLLAAEGPGPLTFVGWGVFLALLAATAIRGFSRLRARGRLLPSAALAFTLLSLLLVGTAQAATPSGQLSQFDIDEEDPESSVPDRAVFRKDPLQFGYLVMDLADKADAAIRRKDYAHAAKYYKALTKVAPDRAIGYGKMCEVYEMAGERAQALDACRSALVTEGVRSDDYDRFVRLSLAGDGPLEARTRTELENTITTLRRAPDATAAAADIECKLALRTRDVARLTRCSTELVQLSPGNANTIGYEWALATLKNDPAEARRVLAKAKSAGVSLTGVERMEQATRRAELIRAVTYALAVAALLAAGALLYARRREWLAGLAGRSAPRSS